MVINGLTSGEVYFLQDMPDAYLSEVTEPVTCLFSIGAELVMSNRYYPDDEGIITFFGLKKLIADYINLPEFNRNAESVLIPRKYVTINVLGTSAYTYVQFYVLYTRNSVGMNPSEVKGFLRRTTSEYTSQGILEYVSFVQRESVSIYADVAYLDGTRIMYKNIQIPISAFSGGIDSVLVSLDRISKLSGINTSSIKQYDIILVSDDGGGNMHYDVDDCYRRFKTLFWYNGIFGTPETLLFTGVVSGNPDYETESVVSLLTRKNVKKRINRKYTVHSGWIGKEKYMEVEDMLESPSIYVYNADDAYQIVIDDAELEHVYPSNEVAGITLTYYPSKSVPTFKVKQNDRIFDNTFDDTFE